jgi:hypothetical protein
MEKQIPVETIAGEEVGRINEDGEGVNSNFIYLIHCKNFCKCLSVPLPSTIKEKRKKKVF